MNTAPPLDPVAVRRCTIKVRCQRCQALYFPHGSSKFCPACRPIVSQEYKAKARERLSKACKAGAVPVRLLVPKPVPGSDGQPPSRHATRHGLRRIIAQGRYAVVGVPAGSGYAVGASFSQCDLIETLAAGNWEAGLIFKGPGGIMRVIGEIVPQRLERWCVKCEQYRAIADFYAAEGGVLTDYCLHCTPGYVPEAA